MLGVLPAKWNPFFICLSFSFFMRRFGDGHGIPFNKNIDCCVHRNRFFNTFYLGGLPQNTNPKIPNQCELSYGKLLLHINLTMDGKSCREWRQNCSSSIYGEIKHIFCWLLFVFISIQEHQFLHQFLVTVLRLFLIK